MPEVICPNCGHKLNVPDAYLGQEVRCSVCNVTFVTPTNVEQEPSAGTGGESSAAINTAAGPNVSGPSSVAERQRERRRGFNFISWLDSDSLGKPLLFLGLILVILGRGCDGLGARWANRVRARAEAEPRKFQQKTSRLLRDAAADKRADITKERNEARDKLKDKWSDLKDSSDNARANHIQWAFYYHSIFVMGSLMMTFGLLVVGFNGTGSERLVCLIMIAIVTASIYIVGVPWLEGSLSTMMGR